MKADILFLVFSCRSDYFPITTCHSDVYKMICNHYSALQMADLDVCQYRRKDINSMLSFDVNYFCLMGLTWERYRRHWRVRILRVTSGNLTWFCTIRIFTASVLPGSEEGQVCMQWHDLINGEGMQGRLKSIHYAKVKGFKGTDNKLGPSLV
jgi:hypothetical protein